MVYSPPICNIQPHLIDDLLPRVAMTDLQWNFVHYKPWHVAGLGIPPHVRVSGSEGRKGQRQAPRLTNADVTRCGSRESRNRHGSILTYDPYTAHVNSMSHIPNLNKVNWPEDPSQNCLSAQQLSGSAQGPPFRSLNPSLAWACRASQRSRA